MVAKSLTLDEVATGECLRVHLLGRHDFAAVQALQRAVVFQIQEHRDDGALIVCEHAPVITVGRQAGAGHICFEMEELRLRQWPVRWVNRGGGTWLQVPGQMAVYSVLALDRLVLGVSDYVGRLQRTIVALLADFRVPAVVRSGEPGIWVGQRMIAEVGVAVRDWVAHYGFVLNLHPDLLPFRSIRTGGAEDGPMTSLERERRGPFRPALVRELFLEHFTAHFPFQRTTLFFDHPALARPTVATAAAISF